MNCVPSHCELKEHNRIQNEWMKQQIQRDWGPSLWSEGPSCLRHRDLEHEGT